MSNEICNLAHGFALDHDGEIKSARHKQKTCYLGVIVDLFGNLIKAEIALRLDLDLNKSRNIFAIGLIPVDKGLVAEQNAVALIFLNYILFLLFHLL